MTYAPAWCAARPITSSRRRRMQTGCTRATSSTCPTTWRMAAGSSTSLPKSFMSRIAQRGWRSVSGKFAHVWTISSRGPPARTPAPPRSPIGWWKKRFWPGRAREAPVDASLTHAPSGRLEGQELDSRLPHRRGIELHQVEHLLRQPDGNGKAETGRFVRGERVIMRPCPRSQRFGQRLCLVLRDTRGHDLDRAALDLRGGLLAHIREDEGQVRDMLDRLGLAGSQDRGGRDAHDLRVDGA